MNLATPPTTRMFFLCGGMGSLVLSLAAVLWLNFQPAAGPGAEPLPPFGPGVTALCWLAVFSLPPLATAFWARRRGAALGLMIGLVPLGVAGWAGYAVPAFIALAFYFASLLGGWLGQILGRSRAAKR